MGKPGYMSYISFSNPQCMKTAVPLGSHASGPGAQLHSWLWSTAADACQQQAEGTPCVHACMHSFYYNTVDLEENINLSSNIFTMHRNHQACMHMLRMSGTLSLASCSPHTGEGLFEGTGPFGWLWALFEIWPIWWHVGLCNFAIASRTQYVQNNF